MKAPTQPSGLFIKAKNHRLQPVCAFESIAWTNVGVRQRCGTRYIPKTSQYRVIPAKAGIQTQIASGFQVIHSKKVRNARNDTVKFGFTAELYAG